MTNMFKRSLIAMAVASVSAGAMAADVTPTNQTTATNEFMSTMDEIMSKNVVIDIQDEYRVGDEIYLRLEGDAYIGGAPAQVTVPPVPNFKGVTLDYRATTTEGGDTVIVYRVSELSGVVTDTTIGVQFDFGRFNFDAQKVVAQNGVVFTTFSRPEDDKWVPGTPLTAPVYEFDEVTSPMTDNVQLFLMGDQFYLDVADSFEGELDVWDFRRSFRDAAPGSTYGDQVFTSDATFWARTTLPPVGSAWDYEVDVDPAANKEVVFTISGDNMFGWIESADPTAGFEATLASNGCAYVSHNANALAIRCDDVDVPTSVILDLASANPDSGQNPKQDGDFSLSATVYWYNFDSNYTGLVEDGVLLASPAVYGSTDLGPMDLGKWTANGSITHIPYMPYAPQSAAGEATPIGQIIYVTNSTRDPGFDDVLPPGNPDSGNGEGPAPQTPDIDRAIWVEGIDENGNTFGPVQLPVFADPGVTGISGHIRNALLDANMLTNGARMSLTITVGDYPTNISVYSAYNVNGSDRGWVQNDSMRTDVDLYKGNGIID